MLRELTSDMLASLGFDMDRDSGRMCSLCPRDAACTGHAKCDLGQSEVWVPDHVAAIVKINQEN
jgi:hypothetical protein